MDNPIQIEICTEIKNLITIKEKLTKFKLEKALASLSYYRATHTLEDELNIYLSVEEFLTMNNL